MAEVPFRKVLVANRGEIAVRVMRTLRRLDVRAVAVYSDVDATSLHVQLADEHVLIGPAPVRDSYLRIDRIIEAALDTGAQAVHPGYGLLAENAAFARACEDAGLLFLGPSPEAIEAMGSKVRARQLMVRAGVPVVPGTLEAITPDRAAAHAEQIGYPIAVKAAGAGGGKGFRVAHRAEELNAALEGARGEGARFFGDDTVYLERYLNGPRHVEVQVLGDQHGNLIHLFERDCSIQRRHQKLVEEAPAPGLSPELRAHIGQAALEAARSVGYHSAGTVEGLLHDGTFYFLEMNTRIQVEHTVTESVTGLDIVEEQLHIASGEVLRVRQEDVVLDGHAIECRINAEDAARGFLPSPGRITSYSEPTGVGVRVDSGVAPGSVVHPYYDPLIAKLVVRGADRQEATRRMLAALDDFSIDGIATLIPFHRSLLTSPQWAAAETCADLLADHTWLESTRPGPTAQEGGTP